MIFTSRPPGVPKEPTTRSVIGKRCSPEDRGSSIHHRPGTHGFGTGIGRRQSGADSVDDDGRVGELGGLGARECVESGLADPVRGSSSVPLAQPELLIVMTSRAAGDVDDPRMRRPLDASRSQRLLTPRKPKSKWSGPNKARIVELTAAGLMHPAGQAMVDLAKRTGTWTALDSVEELVEPDELRAALDGNPDGRRYWDAFPRSTRRAILEWIGSAKRQDTRGKRIIETAQLATLTVRANQWPRS